MVKIAGVHLEVQSSLGVEGSDRVQFHRTTDGQMTDVMTSQIGTLTRRRAWINLTKQSNRSGASIS